MEVDFTGKVALVTGAGRGIGRAIVKGLVDYGADVYALSVTKENLDSLVTELPRVHPVHVSLSDWDATRKTVERIGRIDLLVNNAGIVPPDVPFVDTDKKIFDDIFNVNLMGAVNVAQVAAKSMIASGSGGAIVNISSVNAYIALNKISPYNMAKAALDMMTKCLAMELGPNNIRVNSVNPTVTLTDTGRANWSDPKKADPVKARIPLGRFAEVDEVVNTVLYLLSDKASYVTGTCMPVDGGLLCN